MTQEEHWKKAYRDKCKEMSAYQNATFNKLKKYFEEKKGKEDELVARIHQKYNDAELLISELERVLFFTHDDIRSSLAEDTVNQIEGALDKIRIYQGLKPRFK